MDNLQSAINEITPSTSYLPSHSEEIEYVFSNIDDAYGNNILYLLNYHKTYKFGILVEPVNGDIVEDTQTSTTFQDCTPKCIY